jgi:hypothetical protein
MVGLLAAVLAIGLPASGHAAPKVVTLLDNVTLADGDVHLPSVSTEQFKRVTLFGRAVTPYAFGIHVRCGFALEPTSDPTAVVSVANVIATSFQWSAAGSVLVYDAGQPPTDIQGPNLNLACTLSCTGITTLPNPPDPGTYIPCSGTMSVKALLSR